MPLLSFDATKMHKARIEAVFRSFAPQTFISEIERAMHHHRGLIIRLEEYLGAFPGGESSINLKGWAHIDEYKRSVNHINNLKGLRIEESASPLASPKAPVSPRHSPGTGISASPSLAQFGLGSNYRLFKELIYPFPPERVVIGVDDQSPINDLNQLNTLCFVNWCLLFLHQTAPCHTLSLMHSLAKRAQFFPENSPLLWIAEYHGVYARDNKWFMETVYVRDINPSDPSRRPILSTTLPTAPISTPRRALVSLQTLRHLDAHSLLYLAGSGQAVAGTEEISFLHEILHFYHYLCGYFPQVAPPLSHTSPITYTEEAKTRQIESLLRADSARPVTSKRRLKMAGISPYEISGHISPHFTNVEEFLTIGPLTTPVRSWKTENAFRAAIGFRNRTGHVGVLALDEAFSPPVVVAGPQSTVRPPNTGTLVTEL